MKTIRSFAAAICLGTLAALTYQQIFAEESPKIWCDYAAHEAYIKLGESPSQNQRAPDYDNLCRCLEWKQ